MRPLVGLLALSGLLLVLGAAEGWGLLDTLAYTLLLTSYRFSPARWWERWRLHRIKRKYRVIEGGRDKKRWIN